MITQEQCEYIIGREIESVHASNGHVTLNFTGCGRVTFIGQIKSCKDECSGMVVITEEGKV